MYGCTKLDQILERISLRHLSTLDALSLDNQYLYVEPIIPIMIQNIPKDNDIETSDEISGGSVGDEDGFNDGELDGDVVGTLDGWDVVGPLVGVNDGWIVGDCVGDCVILGLRSSN